MWLVKGKAVVGKVKGELDDQGLEVPLSPTVAQEDKLVIEPGDLNFEADLGHPGCPKYVMYMETETGFNKIKVYEEYDSDLSFVDADGKVRDIPMSPYFSRNETPMSMASWS